MKNLTNLFAAVMICLIAVLFSASAVSAQADTDVEILSNKEIRQQVKAQKQQLKLQRKLQKAQAKATADSVCIAKKLEKKLGDDKPSGASADDADKAKTVSKARCTSMAPRHVEKWGELINEGNKVVLSNGGSLLFKGDASEYDVEDGVLVELENNGMLSVKFKRRHVYDDFHLEIVNSQRVIYHFGGDISIPFIWRKNKKGDWGFYAEGRQDCLEKKTIRKPKLCGSKNCRKNHGFTEEEKCIRRSASYTLIGAEKAYFQGDWEDLRLEVVVEKRRTRENDKFSLESEKLKIK